MGLQSPKWWCTAGFVVLGKPLPLMCVHSCAELHTDQPVAGVQTELECPSMHTGQLTVEILKLQHFKICLACFMS